MAADAPARPVARPLAVARCCSISTARWPIRAGDLAGAVNRMRARARSRAGRRGDAAAARVRRARAACSAQALGVTPDDADYPALRDTFLAYYAAALDRTTRLFDGVTGLLDALDARGLRWGIVTNKAARFTAAGRRGARARSTRRCHRVGRHDRASEAASGAAAARGRVARGRCVALRLCRRRPARRDGRQCGGHGDASSPNTAISANRGAPTTGRPPAGSTRRSRCSTGCRFRRQPDGLRAAAWPANAVSGGLTWVITRVRDEFRKHGCEKGEVGEIRL